MRRRGRSARRRRVVRSRRRRSSRSTRSTILRRPPTSPRVGPSSRSTVPGPSVRRFPLPSFPLGPSGRSWKSSLAIPPSCGVLDLEVHRELPNNGGVAQTGRIWQAEEVREGDRWRPRYYGFRRPPCPHAGRRRRSSSSPLARGARLVVALGPTCTPRGSSSRRPRPPRPDTSRVLVLGTTAGSRRRLRTDLVRDAWRGGSRSATGSSRHPWDGVELSLNPLRRVGR